MVEILVNVKNEGKAPNVTPLPQADLVKGATGYVLVFHLGDQIYTINVPDIIGKLALALESDKNKADAAPASE